MFSDLRFIKKMAKKALVSFVAMTFFSNFVLADARAVVTEPVLSDLAELIMGEDTLTLDVETFTLPSYLGTIKFFAKGSSDKFVVHIQDAHCNYAAQKRTAEIIDYLVKQYGMLAVNLEGGAGDYDLGVFQSIEDPKMRDTVADHFVAEGLVNGAEYYAVNNPDKVMLWGIEDPALYVANLSAYRDNMEYSRQEAAYIEQLSGILDNLKRHIYSKELLELDQKYSLYKSDALGFKEYLNYLIDLARARLIEIKRFPNIYLLYQSMQQEGEVDFKKANSERDALISRLQGMLSKRSLEELVLKTLEFRAKRISPYEFYDFLIKKAKLFDIRIDEYPEFQKYAVYITLFYASDRAMVMSEMTSLEDEIKDTLFENDKQRELSVLAKNLVIMKNLFSVSLTKDDYLYYTRNKSAFEIGNFMSFINREAPLYKINVKPDDGMADMDVYRENLVRFYDYSFERDEKFIGNIAFAGGRQKKAIVVTGGFHTDNLCDLYKKNGISYVSIIPNFTNPKGYESPYYSLLGGEENPVYGQLADILASASAIMIASQLNALGGEVWGRSNVDAFKAAVTLQARVAGGKAIKNVVEKNGNVVALLNDGTESKPMSLRELLYLTHEDHIDAQMKGLAEENFEDVYNIDGRLNEIFGFMKNLGASDTDIDTLRESLTGRNDDGRAWIRFVKGVSFTAHAGGSGIRINASLKASDDPKAVNKAILHELVAGLYGDHRLAALAERAYSTGIPDPGLLAGLPALPAPVWQMLPAERVMAARDYAAAGDEFRTLVEMNRQFSEDRKIEELRTFGGKMASRSDTVIRAAIVKHFRKGQSALKPSVDAKEEDAFTSKVGESGFMKSAIKIYKEVYENFATGKLDAALSEISNFMDNIEKTFQRAGDNARVINNMSYLMKVLDLIKIEMRRRDEIQRSLMGFAGKDAAEARDKFYQDASSRIKSTLVSMMKSPENAKDLLSDRGDLIALLVDVPGRGTALSDQIIVRLIEADVMLEAGDVDEARELALQAWRIAETGKGPAAEEIDEASAAIMRPQEELDLMKEFMESRKLTRSKAKLLLRYADLLVDRAVTGETRIMTTREITADARVKALLLRMQEAGMWDNAILGDTAGVDKWASNPAIVTRVREMIGGWVAGEDRKILEARAREEEREASKERVEAGREQREMESLERAAREWKTLHEKTVAGGLAGRDITPKVLMPEERAVIERAVKAVAPRALKNVNTFKILADGMVELKGRISSEADKYWNMLYEGKSLEATAAILEQVRNGRQRFPSVDDVASDIENRAGGEKLRGVARRVIEGMYELGLLNIDKAPDINTWKDPVIMAIVTDAIAGYLKEMNAAARAQALERERARKKDPLDIFSAEVDDFISDRIQGMTMEDPSSPKYDGLILLTGLKKKWESLTGVVGRAFSLDASLGGGGLDRAAIYDFEKVSPGDAADKYKKEIVRLMSEYRFFEAAEEGALILKSGLTVRDWYAYRQAVESGETIGGRAAQKALRAMSAEAGRYKAITSEDWYIYRDAYPQGKTLAREDAKKAEAAHNVVTGLAAMRGVSGAEMTHAMDAVFIADDLDTLKGKLERSKNDLTALLAISEELSDTKKNLDDLSKYMRRKDVTYLSSEMRAFENRGLKPAIESLLRLRLGGVEKARQAYADAKKGSDPGAGELLLSALRAYQAFAANYARAKDAIRPLERANIEKRIAGVYRGDGGLAPEALAYAIDYRKDLSNAAMALDRAAGILRNGIEGGVLDEGAFQAAFSEAGKVAERSRQLREAGIISPAEGGGVRLIDEAEVGPFEARYERIRSESEKENYYDTKMEYINKAGTDSILRSLGLAPETVPAQVRNLAPAEIRERIRIISAPDGLNYPLLEGRGIGAVLLRLTTDTLEKKSGMKTAFDAAVKAGSAEGALKALGAKGKVAVAYLPGSDGALGALSGTVGLLASYGVDIYGANTYLLRLKPGTIVNHIRLLEENGLKVSPPNIRMRERRILGLADSVKTQRKAAFIAVTENDRSPIVRSVPDPDRPGSYKLSSPALDALSLAPETRKAIEARLGNVPAMQFQAMVASLEDMGFDVYGNKGEGLDILGLDLVRVRNALRFDELQTRKDGAAVQREGLARLGDDEDARQSAMQFVLRIKAAAAGNVLKGILAEWEVRNPAAPMARPEEIVAARLAAVREKVEAMSQYQFQAGLLGPVEGPTELSTTLDEAWEKLLKEYRTIIVAVPDPNDPARRERIAALFSGTGEEAPMISRDEFSKALVKMRVEVLRRKDDLRKKNISRPENELEQEVVDERINAITAQIAAKQEKAAAAEMAKKVTAAPAAVTAGRPADRQKVDISAGEVIERRNDIVKVVVGAPYSELDPTVFKKVQQAAGKFNSEVKAKFGGQVDNKQIMLFRMIKNDAARTAKDTRTAVNQALGTIPPDRKGYVVVYASQMPSLELAETIAREYAEDSRVIVVKDSYADAYTEGGEPNPVDIAARFIVGRQLAVCFNAENDEARRSALDTLGRTLNFLTGKDYGAELKGITDIEGLKKFLAENIIQIKPIDYTKELTDYMNMTTAVAVSL